MIMPTALQRLGICQEILEETTSTKLAQSTKTQQKQSMLTVATVEAWTEK